MSADLIRRETLAANNDNYDYGYVKFMKKDVVRYLRENPIVGQTYSNEKIALYFCAGGLEAYHSLAFEKRWLVSMSQRWVAGMTNTYIIWFHDLDWWPHYLYEYGPDALRALPGVETVAELEDGVILRFGAKGEVRFDE